MTKTDKLIRELCLLFSFLAVVVMGQRPDDFHLIQSANMAMNNLKIFIYPKIPDPSYPEYQSFQSFNISEAECNPHFMMERILPEYLRNNNLVTTDPSEADYFLIDHDYACLQSTNRNTSHGPNQGEFKQKYLTSLIENVMYNYPHYNRSGGYDHLIMFTIDSGRCELAAKSLEKLFFHYIPVTFIGNFGYAKEDVTYEVMKRGKAAFNFGLSTTRQHTGCTQFGSGRNIVIPQFHTWKVANYNYAPRPYNAMFIGFVKRGGMSGVNVRPILSQIHSTKTHHDFFLHDNYRNRSKPVVTVADSYFSLCPGGSAPWSVRMYDAIFHHSVPVILADGIVLPFERFLDWKAFTIKQSSEFKSIADGVALLDNLRETAHVYHQSIEGMMDEYKKSSKNNRQLSVLHKKYVQQKLLSSVKAMPWLSWNESTPHSAYGLLMLELWCKKYGSTSALCNPKQVQNGSEVAFLDYW
jgi:hypothetical protein